MGSLSAWHWLIVIVVLVVLFGSARLPRAARSLGRSIRIFKSEIGRADEDRSAQQTRQEAERPRADAARLERQVDQSQLSPAPGNVRHRD